MQALTWDTTTPSLVARLSGDPGQPDPAAGVRAAGHGSSGAGTITVKVPNLWEAVTLLDHAIQQMECEASITLTRLASPTGYDGGPVGEGAHEQPVPRPSTVYEVIAALAQRTRRVADAVNRVNTLLGDWLDRA